MPSQLKPGVWKEPLILKCRSRSLCGLVSALLFDTWLEMCRGERGRAIDPTEAGTQAPSPFINLREQKSSRCPLGRGPKNWILIIEGRCPLRLLMLRGCLECEGDLAPVAQ